MISSGFGAFATEIPKSVFVRLASLGYPPLDRQFSDWYLVTR